MARKTIAELEAEVAKLSKPITSGNDPRLTKFWELAHEYAEDQGLCGEYDEIVEALDGPPRPKNWIVPVNITVFGSEDDAIKLVQAIARELDRREDVAETDVREYDIEEAEY